VNHEVRDGYRDETMAKAFENEVVGGPQSTRLKQTTMSHHISLGCDLGELLIPTDSVNKARGIW
jgi:hypothetical protein